jgi:MFS family permease
MKFNTKKTFLIGLAFMSICSFWQLYDNIIPLILKDTFKVGDTFAGLILALDNVLALFMLPLFGMISDRTNTRIGKRTPFILVGTFVSATFMLLLPIADNIKSLPLFIVSLLLVLISMSTYRSPAVALMPDLTPKPLRSKANAVINLMGGVGGIITLVLISFLVPKNVIKPNYFILFALVAIIMILSVIILKITIPEKKFAFERSIIDKEDDNIEVKKHTDNINDQLPVEIRRSLIFLLFSVSFWFMGYNAVVSAFSKYAKYYLGMKGGGFASSLIIANAAGIIFAIPIGIIATKVGRKKTVMTGIIMLGTCFIIASFFKTFTPIMNILFALVGISWASINVNSYPMVVEMSKNSNVGKFTGFYYTFSMSAQIITPILSGFLLENMGYWTLFPYAALFVVFAFITMRFVKHGDSKPMPIKSKLEAYDVVD